MLDYLSPSLFAFVSMHPTVGMNNVYIFHTVGAKLPVG